MKTIILFFGLIALSNAAVFFIPAPADRDYQGCRSDVYPDIKEMDINQVIDIANECLQANCREDGSISIFSCPPAPVIIGHKADLLKPDYKKPYPGCCPKPILF